MNFVVLPFLVLLLLLLLLFAIDIFDADAIFADGTADATAAISLLLFSADTDVFFAVTIVATVATAD